MDPTQKQKAIRLLIKAVRDNHVPLVTTSTYNQVEAVSYCWGCKGLVYDCPVIKAADKLEKEYAEEESDTGSKTSS